MLLAGVILFALAFALLSVNTASILLLAVPFLAAGIAIGCVETPEHSAVAALTPIQLRGSAFGLLATIQAVGNLAASAIAGLLWTAGSASVAFIYLTVWMAVAATGLAVLSLSIRRPSRAA